MAFRILFHAFRMIFENFWYAAVLLIVPNLFLLLCLGAVFAASGIWIMFVDPTGFDPERFANLGNLRLRVVATFVPTVLVLTFVGAWVAVSWHRLILRNEPIRLIPPIMDRVVWAYGGQAILIALATAVFSLVISFVIGVMVEVLPQGFAFSIETVADFRGIGLAALMVVCLTLILAAPSLAIFLHLSVMLVGTAVGKPLDIHDIWESTRSRVGAIFLLSVLLIVLFSLPQFVLGFVGLGSLLANGILGILANAFTMLLGVSVITSLYSEVQQTQTKEH